MRKHAPQIMIDYEAPKLLNGGATSFHSFSYYLTKPKLLLATQPIFVRKCNTNFLYLPSSFAEDRILR